MASRRREAASRRGPPVSARYELITLVGRGGMANVYVGRLRGVAGFSRLVAIKRAHEHVAEDKTARKNIREEARIASQLHHPNVVAVQDVEDRHGELLLVMDYVEGASLATLLNEAHSRGTTILPDIIVRIGLDVCAGLYAAHELRDQKGNDMRLIHRDVSPQNVLVGVDGITRLTDFGIARTLEKVSATFSGTLRGKVAYMSPEYIDGDTVGVQADIFALAVVLWEALANERLFQADTAAATLRRVLLHDPPSLSAMNPAIPAALDEAIRRALAKKPADRFESARDFARALERAARPAGLIADHATVGSTTESLLHDELEQRRAVVREWLGTPSGDEISDHSSLGDSTPMGLRRLSRTEVMPVAQLPTPAGTGVTLNESTDDLPRGVPRRSTSRWAAAALVVAAIAGGAVMLRRLGNEPSMAAQPPDDPPVEPSAEPSAEPPSEDTPAVAPAPIDPEVVESAVVELAPRTVPRVRPARPAPAPPPAPLPVPAIKPKPEFAPNPYD